MFKNLASNTFLGCGVTLLVGFGAIEFMNLQSDPLLPASAALCIGCTAILDRIGLQHFKK